VFYFERTKSIPAGKEQHSKSCFDRDTRLCRKRSHFYRWSFIFVTFLVEFNGCLEDWKT